MNDRARIESWFNEFASVQQVDFDNPSFYEALKTHLLEKKANYFKLSILTIEQVRRLRGMHPKLNSNQALLGFEFVRTFQLDESLPLPKMGDRLDTRARLKRMLAFTEEHPGMEYLRSVILYELLWNGVKTGDYDAHLLKKYLDAPLKGIHRGTVRSANELKLRFITEGMGEAIDAVKVRYEEVRYDSKKDTAMWRLYLAHFLEHPEKIERGKKQEEDKHSNEVEGED